MARFDKLEFNEHRKPPAAAQPRRAPAAQSDWMQEADECRRSGDYESALKYYSRALEIDKSLVGGWLGQVQMLVLLEEYPEAELWARKALELFPSNGDLMAGRAKAMFRMGDGRQACVLSDGALQQPGQSAYRWMVRGEIMLSRKGEVDRHCFDKAQQIDGDWLVPLEIALVYLHHGNPSKALPRAHRAVELAAESFYPWYVQGRCQLQLGLDGAARTSLETCLELRPGQPDAERLLTEMRDPGGAVRRWFRRLFRRS